MFSFINIFGLALSISVCMIVLISIVDAFEYDSFHPDRELIYRVTTEFKNPKGKSWTMASSPLPLKQALLNDSSDAAEITRIYPDIHFIAKDRSREFDANGVFIEPSFFSVFGFRCQHGDPSRAMAEPNRVLLSQAFSEKFYGQVDPTGKTLTLGDFGEFDIAGVVSTPTTKSHIAYDVFISMSTVPANRISIGLSELLLCFGFLLFIGLVTIISQTWKASLENPSRNLRKE